MKTIITPRPKRMQIKLRRVLPAICLMASLLFLGACKKERPAEIIKPAEMENVLYDYYTVQAMTDNLLYEENYKRSLYTDYVFRKHQITQAQFDSSMVWYTREAVELTKIYENVNQRLKDRRGTLNHQIALRDKKPASTEKGDTIDIWYGDRFDYLTCSPSSNKLTFQIPSDENFKLGDELLLKMRLMFPEQHPGADEAYIAMAARFENDSVVSNLKHVVRPGVSTIRLKLNAKIKEIYGFVYYPGCKQKSGLLLLDQIELIRYHELKKKNNEAPKNNEATEISGNPEAKPDMMFGRQPELKQIRQVEPNKRMDSADIQPKRINPRELDRPRAKKQ